MLNSQLFRAIKNSNAFNVENYIKGLDESTIKSILVSKNVIGEGNSKKCFKIPDMPDFVFGIMKDKYNPNAPIAPFVIKNNNLLQFNFGQTIATSKSGIILMKRVIGKPHGTNPWIKKAKQATNDNIKPSENDAIDFYNQLKKIAKYPDYSYQLFATQIKILGQNNIRIDSLNPNNVLRDDKKHRFYLIDIEEMNTKLNIDKFPQPINGAFDMPCLLLDVILYPKWLEVIPKYLRKDFINQSKIIFHKCMKAADTVGLNPKSNCTNCFFKQMAGFHTRPKLWKRYLIFMNILKKF